MKPLLEQAWWSHVDRIFIMVLLRPGGAEYLKPDMDRFHG
jgi:hypothetical protein